MNLFGLTDVGKVRTTNEDNYYYAMVGPNALLAVCDGMGGENAGEVASGIAVEELQSLEESLKGVEELKEARSIIRSVLRRANHRIFEEAQADLECSGMGTTAVVAYVAGKRMMFMNVGDSRGYVIGKEDIRQITVDHSLVEQLIRSGAMTKEEGKHFPGKNMITMAIGTEDSILPDYYQVDLEEGDLVLLCSDGLTNMLEDDQIRTIVKEADTVEQAVVDLIAAANEAGGMDNITAVLCKC